MFDSVPQEKMGVAEQAVGEATATIPPETSKRLLGGEDLSDADRKAVLEVARQALEPFQDKQ
jgi:F-type H+-transporting ATPase subunit alpha